MTAELLVSIVTPSLNQGRFLEETLRSVLEQEYPSVEHLAFDGGSTDGSVEILERYAPRLAYWTSGPDAGQADAINRGWARAQGAIVAYLNSDDCYLPGAIRRAVDYLEEHPDVGIVYGACQVVDAQGRPLGGSREPADGSLAHLLRYPLPQPTMFARRWVLDRIGLLDARYHCTMDWNWTIRAAMAGIPLSRMPGPPLARVRVWEGAKTSTLFRQCVDESLRFREELLTELAAGSSLAAQVRESRAWVCLWPAYELYVRGRTAEARGLLHRAFRLDPAIAASGAFAGLYARTWLGPSGSRAARRIKAELIAMPWLRAINRGAHQTSGWRLESR